MNRRFLLIFLLFSLGIVFIFPQNILAEIQLSKEEGHYLLNSVRQGLIDEWINITSSSDFSQPERQAALFLIRNAIQQKELNYALKELPMDGLESLVKTAISLYFNPPSDAGEILDKIEKSTVEKALEIATEWFLQNEVKVSSGKLTDSFTSYKGNFQESVFYYNLVYRRLNNDYGELVVEFYSPEEVEPKKPEASTIWLKGGYWEFESWQSKGNEKIKPFIIKIKGKVRETSAEGYDWEETLGVEITFPESMPEMPDLPEESTIAQIPIIGDYYLDWRNRIEKTMVLMEKLGIVADIRDRDLSIQDFLKNIKDSTKNTVSKVWSYVAQVDLFLPATIVQQIPSFFVPEPSLESSLSRLKEIKEETAALEEKIDTGDAGGGFLQDRKREEIIKDLIEIQEDLDEINEKIDIISQKTTELLEVKNEERSGEIAEIIEIEEGLDEVEEPEEEDLSEESEQVEMGQEEIGQNFCKNTLGGYPKRDKVIINEIAWMGTSNSANDEWVELKNISGRSINLEGWQLQDGDGQIKIIFNKDSIISADGFYLLERTDDYSVPTIIADFIYTGSLNDKEESLYLFNENCGLEDEVKAIPDWLAGDKLNKRSTERNKSFAWYTYYGPGQDNILGTPKGENSVVPFYSGGGGIVSSLFSDLSKSPSSPEILITEIQIEGKESFYDFIEFYNFATSSLNISGFQLKKKTSFGKEYSIRVFPEGSIVLSQDYFLWLSSEYASSSQVSADVTSSQSLAKNNSIALFDREENILDAVAWGSSTNPFVENVPFFQNPEEGQSLARKWDETNKKYKDINNNHEDFEIQIPTPRIQNQSPQPPQNQLPIAQFFYFPTNPTVNQGIIFDAASSTDPDGTIVGYIWDFGDNATSSFIEATTTYVYSTSGDFLVNLIIIDNNNATDSTTTTVTVSIPTPTLEVVINEIAWMGTRTDDSDEWIELYNNTDEEINLEGWKIKAADNTPEVNLIGVIPSKGYFLLERTDDQTISDIGVDQIYTGALENEGERLELKDDEGNLIDLIDCLSGWFVGRNQKIEENWVRMSMERIRPEMQGEGLSNWITNNGFTISGRDSNNIPIQGTPKNQNSGYNFSETFLISPDVLQDTILTQESSPYVVKGTLTILENINLFIEPGVKIRFVPEYQSGIKAKGTIKAIGEEGNPIVFTSNFGATPGSWETLRFIGPDSILDNVVVRYGGYYFYIPSVPPVVRGAILVEGTDVTIKNSVIENNLVAGVWLNSSNSLIENTIFRNNNQEYHYVPREPGMGITAALFLEGTSSPTLNNLTFEGNAVNIYPTP